MLSIDKLEFFSIESAAGKERFVLQNASGSTRAKHVKSEDYKKLAQELRIIFDADQGIFTTYNDESNTYERHASLSGYKATADAGKSYKSMPLDQTRVELLNTISRCLAITRTLDYVITKERKNLFASARLNNVFNLLCTHICNLQHSFDIGEPRLLLAEMISLEAAFNRDIIGIATAPGLCEPFRNDEEAENFLLYLRNMSSILDSAPTLITNTYDDKGQILLRETAIPITAKTAEQKANLKALGTGYYLQHSPQQRRVDSVMLDLLEKDDRELGAQCRNSHMDGLKNAYLSHTVVYDALAKSIRAESCEVRCATIVYVGKGGTKEEKITAAARNLEQIDWALNNQSNLKSYKEIPRTHLHLSILNTNLPLGHQDEMVKYSAAACTLVDRASFSYTPTNVLGMIDFLKIDTMLTPEVFSPPRDTFLNDLKQCFIDKPETRVSWSHANRVFRAAAVSFIAGHITGRLAITACASGQDRTGTLSAIKAIFMLMEADNVRFSGFESFKREFDIYAEKYVAGKHQAILASLLVAGSPGLKSDSCIAGVLPEKLEESHYWRAAKSNKEAPLGDAGLSMIAEYAKFHHPAHILMAKDKDSSEPHSGAGAGM